MAARASQRWLVPFVVAMAVVLTGCDNGRSPDVPDSPHVKLLVVSQAWLNGQQDQTGAQDRIATLEAAIEDLREETGTGWIGRQDDVTGYLADLSGGSWTGVPTDFMEAHGVDLFGIDATVLDLEPPDTQTIPGMVNTRATQTLRHVPVRDGQLVFTSRAGSVPAAEQLTGVRGRVFPGLEVSTEPRIKRKAAALIAADASGGRVQGRTTLIVLPNGNGVLAWEVLIIASADSPLGSGRYYVDAMTGEIVDIRPISAEGTPVVGLKTRADPDPDSVQVTGIDPYGTPRTANGLRTPEGIAMTDTTTPAWDSGARKGDVSTYDASGIDDMAKLPGRLVVNPDTEVRDPDVLASQAYGREILEYYASMGRNSWDDKGSSLVSSVHFGPPDFCNAMFLETQMLFGDPCTIGGTRYAVSAVDIDIEAHEVTHGVTNSSAGLVYSGQSGALNESFSDYFGNVIGNLSKGTDNATYAEDSCQGMPTNGYWCDRNPDGSASQRYLPNGNGLDQFLRVLDLGARMQVLLGFSQDNGGVHYNSAIWNNALWSIRTQLAKIDNKPGNDSPLAQSFDRAVYGTLTARLGPTPGFLDARAALEQVIIDSSLDPVVLRVAREVFDANKFCASCLPAGTVAGDEVSTAPQTELHPSVSGDQVAWMDFGTYNFSGQVATRQIGGAPATVGAATNVFEVGHAGTALVTLDLAGNITRTDSSGSSTVLARVEPFRALGAGLAGSDAGAVWTTAADTVAFVDPLGTVTTTRIPGLNRDEIIAVGTGGGYVGVGTSGGKVFGWQPGSDPALLGTMSKPVMSVAAHGGNVFAISLGFDAQLFGSDGRAFALPYGAAFWGGAAMSADYVVWAHATGTAVPSGVAPDSFDDTDLHVLSLKTGKIYSPWPASGQQGFPAISGGRLVWQDAGPGGNDIRTVMIPPGL